MAAPVKAGRMNSTVSYAVRALDMLLSAAGVTAVLLADAESGCVILSRGGAADGDPDLSRLAARHAFAVRQRTRASDGSTVLRGEPEEVVLTLQRTYHVVRMTADDAPEPGLFVCAVADRSQVNLAVLRKRVAATADEIELSDEERGAVRTARRRTGPRGEAIAVPDPPFDYTIPPVETSDGDRKEEEELPPFLRTESVLRLLGITEAEGGR